jgi:N-methylhydantoinase A
LSNSVATLTDGDDNHGPGFRLGVDVGGTFIDYVLLDERTGQISIDKEPAYRDAISKQLLVGYDRVVGADLQVSRAIHGSTLVINTILQESGARSGLITTNGFRDVLEIGRGNRTDIYDFFWSAPAPLIPRHLRRQVQERIGFDGGVVEPLDVAEVLDQARFLVEEGGVEVIAICFLHAYANPEHELTAAKEIRAAYPGIYVTASHEVAAEWREFERTSSTVLNGYVMPVVSRYFSEVQAGLKARSFGGDLAVMQSNGGVMPPSVCATVPLRTLESGPAGGVVGAAALADAIGEPNVICADVGGTSFDVALIHAGDVIERFRTEVGRRPVLAPTVDITSIGSGGGSIARIDERGVLRVGPESAGSRPGPACFGFGGTQPTVTDCNLVLGRLDPERFLGGRMKLDLAAAHKAIDVVASPLGMTVIEAAMGVIRLAEADMTYALRLMTVERGYDPRQFALLAYGGGGGLFAAALLDELEIPRAIVPPEAAVFSAWGLLFADYREDAALTRVIAINVDVEREFVELVAQIREDAQARLAAHGLSDADAIVTAMADVRFAGQEHTLTVPVVDASSASDVVATMRRDFAERHRAQYGHADEMRDIEVVTIRAVATASVPHPHIRRSASEARRVLEPQATRAIWFGRAGEFVDAAVWSRADLEPGDRIDGPAIVQEWNATVPVGPGQRATVDGHHNVVISTMEA